MNKLLRDLANSDLFEALSVFIDLKTDEAGRELLGMDLRDIKAIQKQGEVLGLKALCIEISNYRKNAS